MTAKKIIIAYAEALGKGDIPTAFSFFSSTVKWHQPGAHKFSGTKSGTDEIGKMLAAMMEITKGTFILEPTATIMANSNLVAMPVRFRGTIDVQNLDMAGIDLFEVKDGKIANVWLFSDDQEAENKFWGN